MATTVTTSPTPAPTVVTTTVTPTVYTSGTPMPTIVTPSPTPTGAGGCYDIEPQANWKCVFFTLAVAGGYWYLPRNKWILLGLLYGCYLILAYYDYHYRCERNLEVSYLASYYDFAKPQDSEQVVHYHNLCPNQKLKIKIVDLIVLVVLVLLAKPFLRWNPKKNW